MGRPRKETEDSDALLDSVEKEDEKADILRKPGPGPLGDFVKVKDSSLVEELQKAGFKVKAITKKNADKFNPFLRPERIYHFVRTAELEEYLKNKEGVKSA